MKFEVAKETKSQKKKKKNHTNECGKRSQRVGTRILALEAGRTKVSRPRDGKSAIGTRLAKVGGEPAWQAGGTLTGGWGEVGNRAKTMKL